MNITWNKIVTWMLTILSCLVSLSIIDRFLGILQSKIAYRKLALGLIPDKEYRIGDFLSNIFSSLLALCYWPIESLSVIINPFYYVGEGLFTLQTTMLVVHLGMVHFDE